MICKACGKELEENSTFCVFCGAKQEEIVPVVEEKPKSKKGAIIAIIIAAVSLILVFSILVVGIIGVAVFALFVPVKVTEHKAPAYSYDEYYEWENTDEFYIEESYWD